ncbi:MAG: hypothetical protein CHACPFDD_00850 [Phycisphaerae bacterium]|nr:hypothetical protein [Phycisphaerae bacterium]
MTRLRRAEQTIVGLETNPGGRTKAWVGSTSQPALDSGRRIGGPGDPPGADAQVLHMRSVPADQSSSQGDSDKKFLRTPVWEDEE